MNTYAQVLTYAIPGFVVLIIIEHLASMALGIKVSRSMDTISSLSSGMTNTLKDLLGLAVVIVSYSWMVDHIALVTIGSELWIYIICFILVDFASYWSHRFNHQINLMWNRHIIHHSSEEFNLSCALRQSISGIVGVYFFLSIPMALIGIPAQVVAIVAPLHLFAQFWYHTRLIKKMGWLEHIIVTPSHHRVHHAINPEYIDKNYAAIFIIWDKLFGTFKGEDIEIPPVYGVKKPVRTWNPFIINYQHFYQLIKDAWRTKSWVDKLRIWVMPTGWRPSDVVPKYPTKIIEDVYEYEKYDPSTPQGLVTWSWVQLIIHNLLMFFLLTSLADIQASGVLIYIIFLATSIFAYTSLMDVHSVSIAAEIIKFLIGVYIFLRLSWFGLGELMPFAETFMLGYLIISLVLTYYFIQSPRSVHLRPNPNLSN